MGNEKKKKSRFLIVVSLDINYSFHYCWIFFSPEKCLLIILETVNC